MSICGRSVLTSLLLVATAANLAQSAPAEDDAKVQFFEKKVRPILAGSCYNCHSANTNSQGGLRLDDRNGMITGGGRGPAISPGHPEKSLLLRAVHYTEEDLKMPPKQRLSEEQVATLTKWIADGATWPAVKLPLSLGNHTAKYEKLRKEHWAWQPLHKAEPPAVDDSHARTDVDRFVWSKLRAAGLQPVAAADRVTLLRRLTFDLTGLPPTPEELDAFTGDTSTDALAKQVDRLLALRAFGERWGRHWLDVARYGESTGPSRNIPYPQAWRYRDWVIDAFHRDKPYDSFVREQVAGDLLPASNQDERDQHLVATGFLALGVKDVNQRFKVRFLMDNIDEEIDVVGRSVLALTVSCARCHDHKFDPIPTADYYALAGIFHSTEQCSAVRNKMGGGGLDYYDPAMLLRIGPDTPLPPAISEKIEKAKKALADARAEFEALRKSPEGSKPGPDGRPKRASARQKMNQRQQELNALTDPAVNGPVALGVRDSKSPGDTEIRVRGEAEKLGPTVPRGFLSLLPVPDTAPINPQQSGRLQLAAWLTSPKNPLTSRVIVNRVWQHLFGEGLVRSVDNFGTTGDTPSHPELLDYLADRFVRDGWSIKRLIRTLVLTDAYQLSAEAIPANLAVDPANRLVWRHSPRRLDAEEIRDAMLAASGNLDRTPLAASPAKDMKVMEISDDGPDARRIGNEAKASLHRSIYLPLLRGLTPRALEVFDFADQGMVTGNRDATTVATQALYLLNDPFVRRQALALARRALAKPETDEASRVNLVYRLTLGRKPSPVEASRAAAYVADYEASAAKTGPVLLAAAPKLPADAGRGGSSQDSGASEKPVAAAKKKAAEARGDTAGDEPPPADPHVAAWMSFCQALLESAEFRYIR